MHARSLFTHVRAQTNMHTCADSVKTHTHTHTTGSAVAITGVLLYSLAEEAGKKKAKAH